MKVHRNHLPAALLLLLVAGCSFQTGEIADTSSATGILPFFAVAAEIVSTGIEIMGIIIILKGAVAAAIRFVRDSIGTLETLDACRDHRGHLGQAILLGLEFLVAADIIRTVAVRPTYRSVGILGAIVFIRTFLSFALEIEIEGRLPWKMNSD